MIKVLAIIPAKTDSTRLPKKNIQVINGKTLVEYSIEYAKESTYKPDIIVSSENDYVKELAYKNDVHFMHRDVSLLKDAEVTDVYIDVCSKLNTKYDYVVGLQPDHPDREHSFDYCLSYMIDNNYDDLITIEPSFKRSGSVRIFKYNYLVDNKVSRRIGCLRDDATDIHFEEDLIKAKNKLNGTNNR